MAARHGKDTKVYFNGFDFSTFLNEASQPAATYDTADTTTFTDTAKTYIPSLVDATYSLSGLFEGQAGATDQIFNAAVTEATAGDDDLVVLYDGDVAGNTGYATRSCATAYEVTAPVADIVAVTFSAQSTVGVERIEVLYAMTDTEVTGESGEFDNTSATTNGGSVWLQVTDIAGTDTPTLTVALEEAPTVGGSYSVVDTFTAVTAANQHQRIELPTAIDAVVKATWTITGTNPHFTFFVGFNRR